MSPSGDLLLLGSEENMETLHGDLLMGPEPSYAWFDPSVDDSSWTLPAQLCFFFCGFCRVEKKERARLKTVKFNAKTRDRGVSPERKKPEDA